MPYDHLGIIHIHSKAFPHNDFTIITTLVLVHAHAYVHTLLIPILMLMLMPNGPLPILMLILMFMPILERGTAKSAAAFFPAC